MFVVEIAQWVLDLFIICISFAFIGIGILTSAFGVIFFHELRVTLHRKMSMKLYPVR